MDGAAHALDDDEVGAHSRLRQLSADPTQVQARAALPAGYHKQPRFPARGRCRCVPFRRIKHAGLMESTLVRNARYAVACCAEQQRSLEASSCVDIDMTRTLYRNGYLCSKKTPHLSGTGSCALPDAAALGVCSAAGAAADAVCEEVAAGAALLDRPFELPPAVTLPLTGAAAGVSCTSGRCTVPVGLLPDGDAVPGGLLCPPPMSARRFDDATRRGRPAYGGTCHSQCTCVPRCSCPEQTHPAWVVAAHRARASHNSDRACT